MNYEEYYEIFCGYKKIKNDLRKIQNDIENVLNCLISITTKIKDDVVSKNSSEDKILIYMAKKLDLESIAKYVEELLKIKTEQLQNAERELRRSKDLPDIIYVKYFIDHMKVRDISKDLNFARSYIYDILSIIKHQTYEIRTKLDKSGHLA